MTVRLRVAVLLVLSTVLAACGGDGPEAAELGNRPAQPPATAVTMATVQPSTIRDSVQALGTVRAVESVTVTAKVSETVEQVHFASGDRVNKGDPLVTLSGRQQQASLAAAQATAEEAERLHARYRQLASQQLIASAQLDTQRATRDAAVAQVRQIRANLADRVIRAPFAGVLGIRQVSPGALVTPGTAIATLDAIDEVYVDFPLPETRLSHLADGERLIGTVAAWPGVEFTGVVSSVDARLDPDTRALTVRGEFANAERRLRPGMLMTVQLLGSDRQALMVPEIAVTQVGEQSSVFVVDEQGTAHQREVQLGVRQNGRVEVLEGLAAGARIVVDGVVKVADGQTVREAPDTGQAAGSAPAPATG